MHKGHGRSATKITIQDPAQLRMYSHYQLNVYLVKSLLEFELNARLTRSWRVQGYLRSGACVPNLLASC
jgi:hypothetical protein